MAKPNSLLIAVREVVKLDRLVIGLDNLLGLST